MLPAVTHLPRRVSPRRVLLGAASIVLAAAAVATQLATPAVTAAPRLADELGPATWAMEVPVSWLAAPVPAAGRGDALDLLAVRAGDRAYAYPVAYGLAVISVDQRGLVLEVDEDDAIAIASAKAGGLLLVPLLRSRR
jgi:hypothetical protein